MTETVKKGQWVEIGSVVLPAGERAPQVPEDTKRVALEMRVKGLLENDAAVGDEAHVVTSAGRRVSGTLVAVNPAYTHGFGSPIQELATIGPEARRIVAEYRKKQEK